MNLKTLLKKITRSNISIYIRNNLNLKKVDLDTDFLTSKTSISDAFCWRTDKGYKTILNFSNLIKMFFNEKSNIKIIFYSKFNLKIKEILIESKQLSHSILIDKDFMNGLEDYGTFYIFHDLNDVDSEAVISNRCYVGYSLKNELPSFIHGNTLTKYKSNSNFKKDIVKKTLLTMNTYTVQNEYNNDSEVEIYLANPTSKNINVIFYNEKFILEPYNCKILESSQKKISLKSDCMFLRPIVFESKNNFINVHHG